MSQLLLAVPLWLLYEFGILLARFFVPPVADDAAEPERVEVAATSRSQAHWRPEAALLLRLHRGAARPSTSTSTAACARARL